jgi:glutamate-1-semialdehyde aminotransferase
MTAIETDALRALLVAEQERFERTHPRAAAHHAAESAMLGGVPMPWMMRWAGGFPVIAAHAKGARLVDTDGHEYVDLCLGDTGAMAGHAPDPVVAAASAQLAAGVTMMLPTGDAEIAAGELAERFGLPRWVFTLSATDANRTALRIARHLTGRGKILCFSYSYHGSVDETFAVRGEDGRTVEREGNVGPPVDVAATTRAIEWNDLAALREALAHGDVACVLAEPAMTNMGIVLPDDGYHDELRRLTREAGTLLIIDETHTFSAGPGGCTAAWGLEPDMLTIGKAIAGGVPTGALGIADDLAARILGDPSADLEDVGGVGGTLAGNALSLAATRAALTEVLTAEAFAHAIGVATRLREGIEQVIAERDLPWHAVQLGARVEYRFAPEAPRNGTESHAIDEPSLERYLHLHALNRGVLITPFHNMLLASPATTVADADRHTEVFAEAVSQLA